MNNLRKRYDTLVVEKAMLLKDRADRRKKQKEEQGKAEIYEKANLILNEVGKQRQRQFKKVVDRLVGMAIISVFEDRDLSFHLEFDKKAGKTTCIPIVKEGDSEYIPKDDMGGSIIDVISLALRIVLWLTESPRSRPIFILDEPFKFAGVYLGKICEMLKKLSRDLELQIIMITYDEEFFEGADRVFLVRHNGKESIVNRVIKRRR